MTYFDSFLVAKAEVAVLSNQVLVVSSEDVNLAIGLMKLSGEPLDISASISILLRDVLNRCTVVFLSYSRSSISFLSIKGKEVDLQASLILLIVQLITLLRKFVS
jgi:hypothetical protein